MKPENILEAMEHIKPDYIAEAKPSSGINDSGHTDSERSRAMKKITQHIMTGVSVAAAVAVCAGVGVFITKGNSNSGLTAPQTTAAVPSAAGSQSTTAATVTTAPATTNYFGGHGKLHAVRLGSFASFFDDDNRYLFTGSMCIKVPRSAEQYIPAVYAEDISKSLRDKITGGDGNNPVFSVCVDNRGQVYLSMPYQKSPDAACGDWLFRLDEDGNAQKLGFFSPVTEQDDKFEYQSATINSIKVSEDNPNQLSISGTVLRKTSGDSVTRKFLADAELLDGSITVKSSIDAEYTDPVYVGETDGRGVEWKVEHNVTAPVSGSGTNAVLQIVPDHSGKVYALSEDGKTIWKADEAWKNVEIFWDLENDKSAWESGENGEQNFPNELLHIIGVCDGKLIVLGNNGFAFFDTETGDVQYIYDAESVKPKQNAAQNTACPLADFSNERVRICHAGIVPNVLQAAPELAAELYSILDASPWTSVKTNNPDGENFSVFVYNSGNPYRLIFYPDRTVEYLHGESTELYQISETAYQNMNKVIHSKDLSDPTLTLIECSMEDVSRDKVGDVWNYADRAVTTATAVLTDSSLLNTDTGIIPAFCATPVPYDTIYRLISITENGETTYYRAKYVGDFKYSAPDYTVTDPDELVYIQFAPEAFANPEKDGQYTTRNITDDAERKMVLRDGRTVRVLNGSYPVATQAAADAEPVSYLLYSVKHGTQNDQYLIEVFEDGTEKAYSVTPEATAKDGIMLKEIFGNGESISAIKQGELLAESSSPFNWNTMAQ